MSLRVFSLCLCLLLGACGFHLRALQQELPFKTVFVSGDTELARLLRQEIEQLSGSRLSSTIEEAEADIRISSEIVHPKRIIALTRGGKVAEYQMRYTVEFAVYAPGSRQLQAPVGIELRRDFPYDDRQTLAKEDEEQRLLDNMRQQAVETVLRRVSALHHRVQVNR